MDLLVFCMMSYDWNNLLLFALATFNDLAENPVKIGKKKKGEKSPRKKKVKKVENNNAPVGKSNQLDNETDDGCNEQHGTHIYIWLFS